jgi:drug/metabolite transporter (DMT)-like permease
MSSLDPPFAPRGLLSPVLATGLTLLAALAWGTGNVAQKTILDHLDPLAAAGFTSIIGAIALMPMLRHEGRTAPPPQKGAIPLLLAVGIVFTLAATLMQFGYGLTTVTNASFLGNTSAVLTPILAWVWFRDRPAFAIWPAAFLSLAGVYCMAGAHWGGTNPGDLLVLASAGAYAVWSILVGRYVMRTRRPILMTVVQLLLCGAICIGLGALVYGPTPTANLIAAWPELLWIGIISKGLAYVLMAIAQQSLSAATVSILVSAEAVFGALIAAVVLGETLDALGTFGAVLILTGVYVVARLPCGPIPGDESGDQPVAKPPD